MNNCSYQFFIFRGLNPIPVEVMLEIVCRNHFFILVEGEATGRLLRYDPPTKTIHVVLDGLAFPNGIQLFEDQSFLLLTETTNYR